MGSPAEPGLMSQSIEDLFSMCDAKKDHEFLCRMSYIEIYNEEVWQPQPSRKRCTIDHTYVLLHILYIYYTYAPVHMPRWREIIRRWLVSAPRECGRARSCECALPLLVPLAPRS